MVVIQYREGLNVLSDLSHYDLGVICPTHYRHSVGH